MLKTEPASTALAVVHRHIGSFKPKHWFWVPLPSFLRWRAVYRGYTCAMLSAPSKYLSKGHSWRLKATQSVALKTDRMESLCISAQHFHWIPADTVSSGMSGGCRGGSAVSEESCWTAANDLAALTFLADAHCALLSFQTFLRLHKRSSKFRTDFFFFIIVIISFFFHKVTAEATTKHCAMKPLTAAANQPVLADTNSLALSFWPPPTCPSFFSTSIPLLYLVHQRTFNCLA